MTDALQAVMGARREPMNARLSGPSPREAARSKGPSASPIRIAPSGVLSGPIAPVMLRLALPTITVLVAQALVGVAETYFVSFLGTEALAGVALVFPVLMLVQMMSNGGIGGGVAAAVARALGADRDADAQALAWHAMLLACGLLGLLFTVGAIAGGPALYRAMGGTDKTLAAALTYSNVVFAGSVPLWIVALLSSALRGAGDVKTPAYIALAGAVILVALSPEFFDLRLGAGAEARNCGCRSSGGDLLCARGVDTDRLHALGPQSVRCSCPSCGRTGVCSPTSWVSGSCRPSARSRSTSPSPASLAWSACSVPTRSPATASPRGSTHWRFRCFSASAPRW